MAERPELGDMQQGCLWACSGVLMTINLRGDLNYLDPRAGDRPVRVLRVCCTPFFVNSMPNTIMVRCE